MPETPEKWLRTMTGASVMIATAGDETDGLAAVIRFCEPPNSHKPVFTRHEFIEVFCVTEGRLEFQFLDEEPMTLQAGQSVTCTSWKPHAFWNESNESVFVTLICTPAGLDDFFIASDQLLANTNDMSNTALQEAMKALRNRFGLEHVA